MLRYVQMGVNMLIMIGAGNLGRMVVVKTGLSAVPMAGWVGGFAAGMVVSKVFNKLLGQFLEAMREDREGGG
jgi:hypothetical protein